MAKLEKDLQAVTRELKALTKKTERLLKMARKLEKDQATKKPKAKAKAKPARKTAAKKTVPKRKTPAKKKAAALTATDQVVKIIKRSKKGVDPGTLAKKTGFEKKKISDILFRTSKQGKIKRAGKGLYIGA